jgi:hypothetical protein
MAVKCAECQCTPQDCMMIETSRCSTCTKEVCCCIAVHSSNSLGQVKLATTLNDNCCASGACKNDTIEQKTTPQSGLLGFFRHAKSLYAAALGIEILCIAAAEIGENTGLYLFGFNFMGIPIAYAMGYGLAGFTTFATILGRYNFGSNDKIDSCCSMLDQGACLGFIPNLKITFKNFAIGIARMPQLYKQRNLKYILKTSAYILVTAESACILTAETVDLIFYQYSLLLSVPLALVAGAFTVVAPETNRKIKRKSGISTTMRR